MARRDDPDQFLHAVERLATVLSDAGMPRMAARVFSYTLADDEGPYSAADLADALLVSPASISGAVRYLVDAGLLVKERTPGSRIDLYRLQTDDVWSALAQRRAQVLATWEEAAAEAAQMIGLRRPGGRRLLECKEFLRFSQEDILNMVQRWRQHRRKLA